ncbi:hypothetical protein JB92DRAFT_3017900 [Gautieria morchelliformis]|nr:hypothetical protein JB92DRAFT_3017900 [Gautieria morchelliformis]
MPAHECSVTPPMLTAAIPVCRSKDAVMATLSETPPPKCVIISLNRTDFPVPAKPVKNMFFPCLIRSRICCCSSESVIADFDDEGFASPESLERGRKFSVNGSTSNGTLGGVSGSGEA